MQVTYYLYLARLISQTSTVLAEISALTSKHITARGIRKGLPEELCDFQELTP